MRIGVNISIDVKKLQKERFYVSGDKAYANLTAFIDTNRVSDYGDNGVVTQKISKEERESGVKMPIIGNTKVFYTASSDDYGSSGNGGGQGGYGESGGQPPEDDDIPF